MTLTRTVFIKFPTKCFWSSSSVVKEKLRGRILFAETDPENAKPSPWALKRYVLRHFEGWVWCNVINYVGHLHFYASSPWFGPNRGRVRQVRLRQPVVRMVYIIITPLLVLSALACPSMWYLEGLHVICRTARLGLP